MAGVSEPFFDTGVLLSGLIDMGATSEASQRIMTAVADRRIKAPSSAWHCCLEFYSVATRLPEEFRLAPADALKLLEEEILARFEIHELPKGGHRPFLRLAAQDGVTGGRVYDAHIAEIARAAGAAVVVTDNRPHFLTLLRHGIQVLTSREYASAL